MFAGAGISRIFWKFNGFLKNINMLIDKFNKEVFKNKPLAAAVESLLLLEKDFAAVNRSNTLAGVMMALAAAFQDDKLAVLSIIDNSTPQASVPKTPMVEVRRRHSSEQPLPSPDCPTCGQKASMPPPNKPATPPKSKEATPSPAAPPPSTPLTTAKAPETLAELVHIRFWREISIPFGKDTKKMLKFCEDNGIETKGKNDITELAKRIYNALREYKKVK